MKKFLSFILCIAMVLATMSFPVSAVDIDTSRAINVVIAEAEQEVYAGDTITVSIVINGEGMANAQWTLVYDEYKFEPQGVTPTAAGEIAGIDYITDGSTYADGHELATYTFKALAQEQQEDAGFYIKDAHAYSYVESADAEIIYADSNHIDVTILMRQYTVTEKIDGETFTETSFPNDNRPHSFAIDVALDDGNVANNATVTYKVNGSDVSAVQLEGEGEYIIEYTITADEGSGYEGVTTGTVTITITKPTYVVEVNLTGDIYSDYVDGKKIVLVYTNTPGVYFTYDGNAMVDVSASSYEYVNPEDGSETDYAYTFAFVTDSIDGATLQNYKDNVQHCYELTYDTIASYDQDMNFNGSYELQDITTAYGVLNKNTSYYTNTRYQKHILKADSNNNKRVVADDEDMNAVINRVFN